MKHTVKITLILLLMFFITQLIGLFVINQYSPVIRQIVGEDGEVTDVTSYNLPYGMDPPEPIEQKGIWDLIISFVIVFSIAIFAMLLLMKYNADVLLRLWFFTVVTLAMGITINSPFISYASFSMIAIVIAFPLAYFKIFKGNVIVHNLTELLIYPGIAAIFVALLFSWTNSPILAISVILILISLYDMYAVWHVGFMQKMAQYQIQKLKVFSGFFVPYASSKQKVAMAKAAKSKSKKLKDKKIKVSVAILGGGDVIFPLILAGIILSQLGLIQALIISTGATLALAGLFYLSKKGKFYPAMPFISAGCFVGLAVAYMV
jgi:presenilin-like A22 family membrane protease